MAVPVVSILGFEETTLRGVAFLSAFIAFSTLEAITPRRKRNQSRLSRWFTNGALVALSTALIRSLLLLSPILAITVIAEMCERAGVGFLNIVPLPNALEILFSLLLLDLAIWFQHFISHKVPILWRVHRVHHADRDLDASSALRFHPVEILLSFVYKIAIVCLLGPSVVAIVLFEIILNASAMFNHANLSMPLWLDKMLRSLIVTPDMHRIHHSIHRTEHDTNYGFCLSIWDRVFRTYTKKPLEGHHGMTLGLKQQQDSPTDNLVWSLSFPFSGLRHSKNAKK